MAVCVKGRRRWNDRERTTCPSLSIHPLFNDDVTIVTPLRVAQITTEGGTVHVRVAEDQRICFHVGETKTTCVDDIATLTHLAEMYVPYSEFNHTMLQVRTPPFPSTYSLSLSLYPLLSFPTVRSPRVAHALFPRTPIASVYVPMPSLTRAKLLVLVVLVEAAALVGRKWFFFFSSSQSQTDLLSSVVGKRCKGSGHRPHPLRFLHSHRTCTHKETAAPAVSSTLTDIH